jgi:hypothetical protein
MNRTDQLFAEAKAAAKYLRIAAGVSLASATVPDPAARPGQLSADETAKVTAEIEVLQVQAKSPHITSQERGRLAARMLALRTKLAKPTGLGLPPLPKRPR